MTIEEALRLAKVTKHKRSERKLAFWREAEDLIIGYVEGFGEFRISNEGAVSLLADLQKVCGEREADTKRVEWLEENKRGLVNHYNEDTLQNDWWVDETWNLRKIGHTVREAIDAAMNNENHN